MHIFLRPSLKKTVFSDSSLQRMGPLGPEESDFEQANSKKLVMKAKSPKTDWHRRFTVFMAVSGMVGSIFRTQALRRWL